MLDTPRGPLSVLAMTHLRDTPNFRQQERKPAKGEGDPSRAAGATPHESDQAAQQRQQRKLGCSDGETHASRNI